MVNGSSDRYRNTGFNEKWCNERHNKIDKRMDIMENKIWAIVLLLVGNLAGVVGILVTLFSGGGS